MLKITEQTKKDIDIHALQEFPYECCGLIVADKYVPCENKATNREQTFTIDKDVYLEALLSGQLQAVIHSHCYARGAQHRDDPRLPSSNDMQAWIETNITWGIVATDGGDVSEVLWMDDKEPEPLVGRPFVHGVNDCYSLVRDYYRLELGVTLKNYPRQMDWWDNGKDLYNTQFEDAGFKEIPEDQIQVGDLALFQVRSPVINHAAVITGSNEILHHLFHRLSGHDRLDKWKGHIVKYLRFVGQINTSTGSADDKNSQTPRKTRRAARKRTATT